jgi:prepilin-type N-terminal cleavage/methylation domain-containing protein
MMSASRRGFTLVEVLAAACILSLGIVLVHRSFLSSLDAFSETYDYARVSSAADELLWEAVYRLTYIRSMQGAPDAGVIKVRQRPYAWTRVHESLGEVPGAQLWKVEVSLQRTAGRRRGGVTRSTYVLSRQP